MVFWKTSSTELLNDFLADCIKRGWEDLSSNIKSIEKTPYTEKHIGRIIDIVLSRLKLIELLHTDETFGPFQDAGFYNENSLRLYLTTTCFDILGQNKEHTDFIKFLTAKNGETGKRISSERSLALLDININEIIDEDSLIEAIIKFHGKYVDIYGMHVAFQYFFFNILDNNSRDILLKHIWIRDNPFAPNYGVLFLEEAYPRPSSWIELNGTKKLNKIVRVIEDIIRNQFTHRGIRAIDYSDKSSITFLEKQIEKILKDSGKVVICESKDRIDHINTENKTSCNNVTFALDGNELLLFSEVAFKQTYITRSFLELCAIKRNVKKGGCLYYEDMKKVLCYADISLTKLLFDVAKKGLHNYILRNSTT